MKPDGSKTGLVEAFSDAWAGISASAQGRNFRIMCAVGACAIVLGILFSISALEWIAICICIGLVLAGECLNTSVEDAVDLACPHIDPRAKRAKDTAAGAVFLISIASFIVGLIIFLPKVLAVVS